MSFPAIKFSFCSDIAQFVPTMSSATGSEDEGSERAIENRTALRQRCLQKIVGDNQHAMNSMMRQTKNRRLYIYDKKHRKAMTSSEFCVALLCRPLVVMYFRSRLPLPLVLLSLDMRQSGAAEAATAELVVHGGSSSPPVLSTAVIEGDIT